jgi:hypothetical protein
MGAAAAFVLKRGAATDLPPAIQEVVLQGRAYVSPGLRGDWLIRTAEDRYGLRVKSRSRQVEAVEDIVVRGWEDFVHRSTGPMKFRFLIQPAVAILMAIRAGLKDAREGRPAFLWAVICNTGHRRELLRQVWKDVGKVFIVALILDLIYQIAVQEGVYALEWLLTAAILALVPYVLVHGPVSRIARLWSPGKQATEPEPPETSPKEHADGRTETAGSRDPQGVEKP